MKYETIELDLSEFSRETLEDLILYAHTNNLTFEQAINRKVIISLIKSNTDFKPTKIECESCGTKFYGDIGENCFKCKNLNDVLMTNDTAMFECICEQFNNAEPMWMLVDENGKYLRETIDSTDVMC